MRKYLDFLTSFGVAIVLIGFGVSGIINKEPDTPFAEPITTLITMTASWIALYLTTLRPWFRQPILKHSPNAGTATFDVEEGRKTFLRLKIENIGQHTAKNCVARIIELRDEDKTPIQFDALHFFWARQSDDTTGYHPVDIHSGDAEQLDIVRIRQKDKDFKLRASTLGRPLPEWQEDMAIKEYYIKVAIYADETRPQFAWYQIKINPEDLEATYLEQVKSSEMKKKK